MRRAIPLITVLFLALLSLPTAQASWSTTANAPNSFRPERSVTFTYTASSSNAADLPLQWRVNLYTCQDLDADGWCEPSDAHRIDHGERSLNLIGGASQTISWTLSLSSPEGAYAYHIHTACSNNPCAGYVQPGGAHNKTGTFQLAYANTWTRTILAPTTARVGEMHTIAYKLQSTSPDDRDLAGVARLYSTPNGQPESDHGQREFAVNANGQTTLSWNDVASPTVGAQQLRLTDTTAAQTSATILVRDVHLHVSVPRPTYAAGNAFSVYVTLEGHGADVDPARLTARVVTIEVYNGTQKLVSQAVTTNEVGQAHLRHATAQDDERLDWVATASIDWLDETYQLEERGAVNVEEPLTDLLEDVAAIHENLSDVQLKGVHLDELGTRNAWMLMLRAAGAVAIVILLILLVVSIAFRV